MKKYEISYSEVEHYLATTIEAENEEEAWEKFYKELEAGNIPVVNSEKECSNIVELKN